MPAGDRRHPVHVPAGRTYLLATAAKYMESVRRARRTGAYTDEIRSFRSRALVRFLHESGAMAGVHLSFAAVRQIIDRHLPKLPAGFEYIVLGSEGLDIRRLIGRSRQAQKTFEVMTPQAIDLSLQVPEVAWGGRVPRLERQVVEHYRAILLGAAGAATYAMRAVDRAVGRETARGTFDRTAYGSGQIALTERYLRRAYPGIADLAQLPAPRLLEEGPLRKIIEALGADHVPADRVLRTLGAAAHAAVREAEEGRSDFFTAAAIASLATRGLEEACGLRGTLSRIVANMVLAAGGSPFFVCPTEEILDAVPYSAAVAAAEEGSFEPLAIHLAARVVSLFEEFDSSLKIRPISRRKRA